MMIPLMLAAMFAIKHFIANYPFQCSYTSQALQQSGWFRPMLARISIHGVASIVIVLIYWKMNGMAMNFSALGMVALIDMVSHLLIDRFKVDQEFLGRFKVVSQAEFAQIASDYKSSDHDVVLAAQAKSEANKYFWWSEGLVHLLYVLVGLYLVCLVK